MSAVVCDTSVLVKLLVPEDNSDRAEALAASAKLIAPEIIFAEVGNVLWSRIRSHGLTLEAGQILLEKLSSLDLESRPIRPLVARALTIARALDHAIYNCLYLALAESAAVPLVTADLRFISAIRRHKLQTAEVALLGQIA